MRINGYDDKVIDQIHEYESYVTIYFTDGDLVEIRLESGGYLKVY